MWVVADAQLFLIASKKWHVTLTVPTFVRHSLLALPLRHLMTSLQYEPLVLLLFSFIESRNGMRDLQLSSSQRNVQGLHYFSNDSSLICTNSDTCELTTSCLQYQTAQDDCGRYSSSHSTSLILRNVGRRRQNGTRIPVRERPNATSSVNQPRKSKAASDLKVSKSLTLRDQEKVRSFLVTIT
jgi:hypothetical protein